MPRPEPISEPDAIATYLAPLGLNAPVLRGSVEEGVKRHLFQCTKNDPAPGIVGYDKITRGLRDRLLPLGWKRARINQQPSTLNPKTGVAVVVTGGDEFTGTTASPSTSFPKGPATVTNVAANAESFADIDAEFAATVPKVAKLVPEAVIQTWMLMFFVDYVAHEIRAELSLPKAVDEKGVVCEWYERVLLKAIDFDDDDIAVVVDEGDDDDGDDISVEWIGG